jgi:GH15 family glucan-1,4-alpha-glucosidase
MRLDLPPPFPSLDDVGVIGNLHTTAIISRFGTVEWACLPRFDSPSVFARLLDPDRGGTWTIAPDEPYRSSQSYVPSTNLLQTRFVLSDHRTLELLDFMPILNGNVKEGTPLIIRVVEASGGMIPVRVVFAPRFQYGRRPATWTQRDEGWVASADPDQLWCGSPWPLQVSHGQAVVQGELEPGASIAFEAAWGRERPHTADFRLLLQRTDRYWRSWVHGPGTPFHTLAGRWHRYVERSELTVKLLSHQHTGAFVAAATTSLPEWPGGPRNWDYRFVWIRDAAFCAEAMLLLDHLPEALMFLRWALSRLRADGGKHLRVAYGAHGETDLRERTLSHLRGYLDSRPVRVGNAAARQFQLDIYGELLDAAAVVARIDGSFLEDYWEALVRLAGEVTRLWRRPDRGIWESRGPPRHYVHSKLMAWVAIDRIATVARELDRSGPAEEWNRTAERIRTWILEEGYDAKRNRFRRSADSPEVEAANLRIPLVGFLPFDDPRVLGTIAAVQDDLCDGPFVYRYRTFNRIHTREATFLPISFWLVECIARSGNIPAALRSFRQILNVANPLGLFSEEYDPTRRQLLGNFPQALTHIALLRAALAVGDEVHPALLRETVAQRAILYAVRNEAMAEGL